MSSFEKEIHDIQKDVGTFDPMIAASTNIFKGAVKRKTKPHFNKLSAATIALHRTHSLRAFPDFKNQGKPQDYLLHTNKQNIITSFRLGDAGLGNRSMNPIKLCPVYKIGNNTEAHLVFQWQRFIILELIRSFQFQAKLITPTPCYRGFSI